MRPHQSLGNVPLGEKEEPQEKEVAASIGPIRCVQMLGELLNHYERKAA